MLERIPRMSPSRFHSGLQRAANFLTAHSALLICALFLLAGVASAADYRIGLDEHTQREIAVTNWDYILGNGDFAALAAHDRVYGISFELPLLMAERALGLEDYYDVHRLRLILTHLFFIAGAFCCYLLTWRLFNNRLLALLALLLFLLHPRIYAHSFFNSKDLPFLSMFSIALYLLERAFRRGTVVAFALLGVAVGILTDLRIMGVMLFPAVLGMRALDWFYAASWPQRRRILLTAGLFTLIAPLTLCALSPWLWTNPGDYFVQNFSLIADTPHVELQLFRGEWIYSSELPPDYLPTWFTITTPPLILLLGLMGMAAAAGRGLARPGAVLGNTRLRFGVLLLACLTLPAMAVILLGSDMYRDWGHIYYIYVPFVLLAAWGLHWLAAWPLQSRGQPGAAYGLVGAGLALIVLQITQLHPQQQIYFNFLVDRTTPEHLKTWYKIGVWRSETQDALKGLLERYPGETLTVWMSKVASPVALPGGAQQRLVVNSPTRDPDFALYHQQHRPDLPVKPTYTQSVYNNTFLSIYALDAARMDRAAVDAYRELYRQTADQEPIIRAYYDIYLQGKTLTFIRENCQPGERAGNFGVKVYPARPEQSIERLPTAGDYREFYNLGVGLDGRCLGVIGLPDYPIAHIIVRQGYSGKEKYALWEEWYSFSTPPRELGDIVAAIRQNPRQTVRRADFEIFLESGDSGDKRLIYYKSDCSRPEYETRFYLHIYPFDPAALSPERREVGFANQDFHLPYYGGWPGGQCFAIVPLPDYPIAELRTGQYIPGQGQLWTAELTVEQ